MKVRHKRYGAVTNKDWGNIIKIVDNEENNYSGRIINLNQTQMTSTHFHSKTVSYTHLTLPTNREV